MNARWRAPALLVAAMALIMPANGQTSWSLDSPDGRIIVSVELKDNSGTAGYPAGSRLYYSVQRNASGTLVDVVLSSSLGITRQDEGFVDNLSFVSASEQQTIDETYTLLSGKQRVCRNYAHEKVLTFQNGNAARFDIILRAYNDGVAFRYRFPDTKTGTYAVTGEATGFRFPPASRAWIERRQAVGTWFPAHENYFEEMAAGTASDQPGWDLPALFEIDNSNYVLVTESDLDTNYCGIHLQQSAANCIYRVEFPAQDEANGLYEAHPSATLPWTMPWRVLIIGTLGTIAESNLVTDVARPSVVADTSWIKPGRASWSWCSDDWAASNTSALNTFIDLANEMTWEYSLIDAGWSRNDMPGLVTYADQKNVRLLYWYNSGGPHNSVGIGPRDKMHTAAVRGPEMDWLRSNGVAGIKVDFFLSDKQEIIKQYLGILKDAAERHLLVNYHGCTIPRGWRRTYPNLMSMEAVRGAENYKLEGAYDEKAAWHNTILPFTRNAIGPMDYTPVTFSRLSANGTTYAHQVALSVVFESGINHFADAATPYRNLPAKVSDFLKTVPVAWDQTVLVGGEPGKSAIIARRKGDVWYVGGINGENAAKSISVPCSFLDSRSYSATIIADGQDYQSFAASLDVLSAQESASIQTYARGGFVMTLIPDGLTAVHQPKKTRPSSAKAAQRIEMRNHAVRIRVNQPGIQTVLIMDISGAVVKKAPAMEQGNDFEIIGLKPGLYILKMIGPERSSQFPFLQR